MIEVPQIIFHEADEPNIILDLFDSDFVPSEDLREIDFH